jgi:hypothetical protein
VVGYHAQDVVDLLKKLEGPKLKICTIFNPFYKLADNLRLLAGAPGDGPGFRHFERRYGDRAGLLQTLIASPAAPITVTIDKKDGYDADDMKVQLKARLLISARR